MDLKNQSIGSGEQHKFGGVGMTQGGNGFYHVYHAYTLEIIAGTTGGTVTNS